MNIYIIMLTLINDEEVWLDIEGYESHYSISNMGRVYSHKRNILMKNCLNTDGYYQIQLCKDGTKKTITVHCLVGNAFVGKRENGLTFDHIDINKLNNRYDNIRLATKTEQNVNQKLRKDNKSREKCIRIVDNTYRIQIRRKRKVLFDKSLPSGKYTFKDSVRIRDEFLQTLT